MTGAATEEKATSWQREAMVGSSRSGRSVTRMKCTWPGGSSSVLRKALAGIEVVGLQEHIDLRSGLIGTVAACRLISVISSLRMKFPSGATIRCRDAGPLSPAGRW
jgi:hypothetical protein